MDLPARSPDLHRVIETPFSKIKEAFTKELSLRPNVRTVGDAIKLLREVVGETVKPEYIQNLVKAVRKTYEDVVKRKGDWAGQPYR